MLFAAETEAAEAAGWFLEHAWLIPVIPAIAFFGIIFFGKQLPKGGSELGIASMVAAFVLAAGAADQWIERVDASHGEEAEPVIRAVDVVAVGRHRVRHRPADRRPGGDGADPRHVHLHARADLLHRVRPRRPPLHPLLRQPHAVLRRHARDGARTEHGAAHPRLGDHGPLLVPADRALVGGGGQQPGRPQGVLHRARRRHRPAGRHRDAARHLRHARHPRDQRAHARPASSTARTC